MERGGRYGPIRTKVDEGAAEVLASVDVRNVQQCMVLSDKNSDKVTSCLQHVD